MIRPDLHLHTCASDGIYSPDELARLAQKADVTLFSITDHDTLAALPRAYQAAYDRGLAFIPGVEISTEGDEEIHILGYGVSPDDQVLNELFSRLAKRRVDRIRAMGEKLQALGMPVPAEAIIESAGASVGRPHLGRAMVEKGYAATLQEAFDRFLSPGRPAYVPRETPSASQAIALLRERGAVPVLAHPGQIKKPMEQCLPLLRAWIAAGLAGIEVYHPANRGEYSKWLSIARENHLLVTGGSDFHDHSPRHGQIGETALEWPTALQDGWALFRRAKPLSA